MAGRLRLAVTGIQDQWLTGEPKISYFSSIYKRHTRFSTEAVSIPITGNVSLGGNAIARIPNNVGDLLRSVILKLTLGELPNVTAPGNLYNASPSTSVIQYVDLVIGGQTIQRLTGDYIDLYNQLHSNKDDADTTLYYMNGHNNQIQIVNAPRTFYLNLPFYFFRNPSLAIPICAITRQLIEIHIKFRDADDDVTFRYEEVSGNMVRTKTDIGSIVEASIIADFYFITRDEINFLLTRPMEYLITQLQLSTMQFKPNESKKSALLKFTNPVKELFFLAKEETGPNANGFTTIIPDSFSQLGTDIDGTTSFGNAGQSVSVSSDGSRLAVGIKSGGSSSQGIVRVFDWDGTSWTQVGSDIVGINNGDNFGRAVSLSSDGARVAIGAPFADPASNFGYFNSGQVTAYELSGSTWVQMGSVFSGSFNGEQLGYSVSLNSDGTKFAFGAIRPGNLGYVKVYNWSGTSWTQVGSTMVGDTASDQYGTSISLNSDGTRLAVGAAAHNTSGYVKVYEFSGNAWGQLGSIINGEDSTDKFGFSVSLSSDGTRFAAGGIGNTANSGHVRVFEYSSDWTQVGSDIDSESPADNFGYSVSLNSDGTRLAAGAIFNNNNRGHTRVFDWSGSSWNQIGSDIDGEASNDYSGHSVSLSSNGLRLAIGAPNNADGGNLAGHVRVYRMDAELATPEDRLLDTTSSDQAFSSHVTGKRSDYRFVKNIKFECNGKTMFDHTGTYLAYEQSLIHHTGCPDAGYEFYMYSFALKPELYYPTGQLNMSRIIHKKLDVELDEVSTTRNINLSIYALNYNVIHVEGGLAGLKF
tara:strand:+ start:1695 stop:4121 length:2427 start_codon:yes stop_codon:yes gene_type:complete